MQREIGGFANAQKSGLKPQENICSKQSSCGVSHTHSTVTAGPVRLLHGDRASASRLLVVAGLTRNLLPLIRHAGPRLPRDAVTRGSGICISADQIPDQVRNDEKVVMSGRSPASQAGVSPHEETAGQASAE